MRFRFQYQVNKFILGTIALDIEFRFDDLPDISYVFVTNVSFIRARMDRYAIGAEALCIDSGFHHVGIISTPRIAERCEFVDIDTEFSQRLSFAKVNPWLGL